VGIEVVGRHTAVVAGGGIGFEVDIGLGGIGFAVAVEDSHRIADLEVVGRLLVVEGRESRYRMAELHLGAGSSASCCRSLCLPF